jgi:hypothetical protein
MIPQYGVEQVYRFVTSSTSILQNETEFALALQLLLSKVELIVNMNTNSKRMFKIEQKYRNLANYILNNLLQLIVALEAKDSLLEYRFGLEQISTCICLFFNYPRNYFLIMTIVETCKKLELIHVSLPSLHQLNPKKILPGINQSVESPSFILYSQNCVAKMIYKVLISCLDTVKQEVSPLEMKRCQSALGMDSLPKREVDTSHLEYTLRKGIDLLMEM